MVALSTLFVPPAGWKGATAITFHNGKLYFGTLGTFPVRPGTESVYKLTLSGRVTAVASGLTAILGVAFDARGRLFILEADTVAGFPSPAAAGSGKVVCVNSNGTFTTVASGLTFPTAMTFGPDGALNVSNFGFGVSGAGKGQIVRINAHASSCH